MLWEKHRRIRKKNEVLASRKIEFRIKGGPLVDFQVGNIRCPTNECGGLDVVMEYINRGPEYWHGEEGKIKDESSVDFLKKTGCEDLIGQKDMDSYVIVRLGQGEVLNGLDRGIITMKKRECAFFTLTLELGFRMVGRDACANKFFVQFKVELVSWITIVDVSKDGGIIKKIMRKEEKNEPHDDLCEVFVKY
ncbi:unnamed protein product [Dovyalis caffra]|uniref:peptidylprolyl isomerase n=1 Tax=Dovyalis caffra TaxID=77055 RepID=A0AAV1SS75_9ROSI|nr:unnamed protein product [Dovyalis caffra]